MPKRVDHEARQERITDAVCRLAGREGLEGVSLRTVADEAGVSMGQVQHYFSSKDEMLLSTYQALGRRFAQRLGDTAPSPDDPSVRARLQALLMAMLCADEAGRREAPVWVAFMARAAIRPELAASSGQTDLLSYVAEELRTAHRSGEITRAIDAEIEASALCGLADGLMLRILLDPSQIDAAKATMEDRVTALFEPAQEPDGEPTAD